MDFTSAYAHGYARIAACTMPIAIADPARNVETIAAIAREVHDEGVALAVFPELSVSGYALEDLLLQDPLLDAVERGLAELAAATASLRPLLVA